MPCSRFRAHLAPRAFAACLSTLGLWASASPTYADTPPPELVRVTEVDDHTYWSLADQSTEATHTALADTGSESNIVLNAVSANPLYLHDRNAPVDETGTHAYNIFWQPRNPTSWSTYNGYMNQFFGEVNGTGYYGNLTQYFDQYAHIKNHANLQASWQDTRDYPADTVYAADIAAEVKRAIALNNWPDDSTYQYNVFLGTSSAGDIEMLCQGTDSSSPGRCANTASLCAYHGFTNYLDSKLGQYITLSYAVIPYGQGLNGQCKPPVSVCPNGPGCNVDTALQWLAHETFETASDPLLNGWMDVDGEEMADKCETVYSGVVSDSYNHTFGTRHYILQDAWNNAYTAGGTGGGCTPYGFAYP